MPKKHMNTLTFRILSILASKWFIPVSIIAGAYIGMTGICIHQQCTRDMSKGDIPHRMFYVLVQDKTDIQDVTAVLFEDLPKYLRLNPKSSLQLQETHGQTKDGNWIYTVEYRELATQIITLDFQDDLHISERYKVSGDSIEPLFSDVRGPGHFFSSFLIGFILSWLIRNIAKKTIRNKFKDSAA